MRCTREEREDLAGRKEQWSLRTERGEDPARQGRDLKLKLKPQYHKEFQLSLAETHQEGAMKNASWAQRLSLVAGTILLVYALGLFFRLPAFAQLWVWPKASAVGLAFVGAWLAGAASPLIWIGATGQLSAIRSGAVGGPVAFAGSAGLLFTQHSLPGNERYLPFAAGFALGALFAASGLTWHLFFQPPHYRNAPAVVRWVFLVFAAILLPVGGGMVLHAPHIFPTLLSADTAVLYGWFFLGSFAYYLYGFLKPSKAISTAAMLSFLTYDVLLIPPFAAYWSTVPDDFRVNLLVYLTVMAASAIFCVYFLFVHPNTRLFRQR